MEMAGLAPTSIHVSDSLKGCGPALQVPWRARAMPLPGWSMEPDENRMFEPIAFMKPLATSLPTG